MLHLHSYSNFIFKIIIFKINRFMPILQIRKLKVKKFHELRSSDVKSSPYSSLPPQHKATGESNSAFWALLKIILVSLVTHRALKGWYHWYYSTSIISLFRKAYLKDNMWHLASRLCYFLLGNQIFEEVGDFIGNIYELLSYSNSWKYLGVVSKLNQVELFQTNFKDVIG